MLPTLPRVGSPYSTEAGTKSTKELRYTKGSRRAFRLQTHSIPLTRLCGFGTVAVLIAIHNLAMLGNVNWPAVWTFAYVATFYSLGSWMTLNVFFLESHKVHLGTVVLVADVPVLLLAIHLTGGTASWLFLLLAARCTDQIFFGTRRVIWFGHLLVGSYALYLVTGATNPGAVKWAAEAAKLAVLYAFVWYYALTARTLEAVRRRSRRSDAAKREREELSATVGHAIATRGAAVTAILDSLRKSPLTPQQREHVGTLTQVNQSLVKLVNFLNATGNEASPREIEKARFAPRELLTDVALLVGPLAESKGLQLRVDMPSVRPFGVIGDGGKIRQVLLSLAHNAIQFTDYGFVELRAWQTEPGRIGFEIKDSGVGIPLHIQRRVMAPLLRADGSPWYRTRGQGVGLGMSRRLVESMGGALELESVLGLGTTVRFTLNLPECVSADGRPFVNAVTKTVHESGGSIGSVPSRCSPSSRTAGVSNSSNRRSNPSDCDAV